MKVTFYGIVALFCAFAFPSIAQQHYQMLGGALQEFSQTVLLQYEEVNVTWDMEGTIQADLNDGINYLIEHEPGLAETRFSTVIAKDSTLWQAYYFRAAARKQLRQFYGAYQDIRHALKLKPKLVEGHVELAKICMLQNRLTESDEAVNRALKLTKSRPIVFFLKGQILVGQNQIKKALNSYSDCLVVDSLFHMARIQMAMVDLVVNKNEKAAIDHLNRVLTIDSLQQNALLIRSILVFDKDKYQSLQDLTNLILVSPTNLVAYYLRGLLHTELQDYDRAFLDFQKVIRTSAASDNDFEGQQSWIDKKIDLQNVGAFTLTRIYGLNDDDAVKLKQAYCFIITGAYDKSIDVIIATSEPLTEPLAVYLSAVAHEHKGQHVKALELYNKAVAIDNTIVDAYKKRGIYAQELQQWDNSIRDFSTVLRLNPDSYFIYKMRGVSYYYNNQFENAINDYSAYLKLDSTNNEVIGLRGMAYLQGKQRLKAYLDFARSSNQQAFDFKDMVRLVDSVLLKGDTAVALSALQAFTSASSSFTEGYVLLFKILVKRNAWKPVEDKVFIALNNIRQGTTKTDQAYLLALCGITLSKDRPDEALKKFDEAIERDRKMEVAYLERGKLLLKKNKKSKATEDLKMAVSLGSVEARKLLQELED